MGRYEFYSQKIVIYKLTQGILILWRCQLGMGMDELRVEKIEFLLRYPYFISFWAGNGVLERKGGVSSPFLGVVFSGGCELVAWGRCMNVAGAMKGGVLTTL